MDWRRRLHTARRGCAWLAVGTLAGLCVLWIVSLWLGFYLRQGLHTVHVDDGAVSYWYASSNSANYARDNSWKFFPVKQNSVNMYVPLFTQAPGRYDVIARIPLWIPLLVTVPAAAALWRAYWRDWRRRRAGRCPACGYDRHALATTATACPECGTLPAPTQA